MNPSSDSKAGFCILDGGFTEADVHFPLRAVPTKPDDLWIEPFFQTMKDELNQGGLRPGKTIGDATANLKFHEMVEMNRLTGDAFC